MLEADSWAEECDLGQGQVCGGGVVVTARRSTRVSVTPPFAPLRPLHQDAVPRGSAPSLGHPTPTQRHTLPPYPNTTSSVPAPCAWAGVPWLDPDFALKP